MIQEAGLPPILGYLLGALAFVLISEYVFFKTEFAKYLVVLACVSWQLKLSEKNRTDFLKMAFGDQTQAKIRIVENLLISAPFVALLLYKNAWVESAILLILSVFIALFSLQIGVSYPIPTPFSSRPFEFSVGFRKTIFIFPIAYALAIIAMAVGNFNLGIFSMMLIFLFSLTYYAEPEQEFYVWVHKATPKTFLKQKIIAATINVSLLVAPIIGCLLIFYPADLKSIFLFFIIGLLFLWTMVLGKYADYPREMSLPAGMILTSSLFFPPILLVIMPFFYKKSIKSLNWYLYGEN